MPSMTTTIQEVAGEAAGWFEGATRPDGSSFRRVKDGAPEWVTELVRSAHGDFLPEDWRYDKIEDALNYIAGADDPEDSADFADSAVDVYTSDRISWLASNLRRASYCDEGASNLGGAESDVIAMIGLGQYEEAGEIYGLVLQELEQHIA